jgi:hypothetical protein
MEKPFPKRAKLITDGGFYRTMPIDRFVPKICFPLMRKVTVTMAETQEFTMQATFQLVFGFYRVRGGYAEYKQIDVIRNN